MKILTYLNKIINLNLLIDLDFKIIKFPNKIIVLAFPQLLEQLKTQINGIIWKIMKDLQLLNG